MTNNTFLNKVQAERRVLGVVNAHTRHALQLAGLSAAAIDDWQRRQGMVDMTAVVTTLRELAAACQALSDRSHETFHPLERVASEQVEVKCEELELALRATFEEGSGYSTRG
jgi:hypothetical protein